MLVLFLIDRSKFGLLRVGVTILGITSSGGYWMLKANGLAVCVTIHNTSFNLNWGGKGSYKFIKISYLILVLSSSILLAIIKLLLPKFK